MVKKEILEKLIEEFEQPRQEFGGKSYVTRRREWFDKPMESIRPLLAKDALGRLTIEQAQKIYKEMSVGGPKLYPQTFVENGIERIRKALVYLLYGKEPLEERFYNFTSNPESDYTLKGVGRAFASTALLLLDHKEYGIWNGAIDGGLEKLGLMPPRQRGEHLGQTYLRILEVLKKLQKECGFKDLSLVDEFVELIYHNKLGTDVFKEKPQEPPIEVGLEEPRKVEKPDQTHLRAQWLLIQIGRMEGYDVWVAKNDQGLSYKDKRFKDHILPALPSFAGPNVLRIAQNIDVIWFKKGSAQPVRFLEIEHTTSVFSGLLRLNDVKANYPIPWAAIVAPEARRGLFEREVSRPSFTTNELFDVCHFLSYQDLEKLYEAELKRYQILR